MSGEAGRHSGHSIAVVIPTYNRATVVVRAVESALAQGRQPDEILVVDDGSTDGTRERLAAYGDRIQLLTKENAGVSSARNLGVKHSRSDFIAFLDSDDFWDTRYLEAVDAAVAHTHASAGLYFADIRLVAKRGGGTIWSRSGFSVPGAFGLSPPGAELLFLPRQPMLIPATVVRRDVYLRVGGCDERLLAREDTHLFFKVGLRESVCAVNTIAGEVTLEHNGSLTGSFTPEDDTYLASTVLLYGDLLRGGAVLSAAQRRTLRKRWVNARWGLARNAGRQRPVLAFRYAAGASARDPISLLRKGRQLLGGDRAHG